MSYSKPHIPHILSTKGEVQGLRLHVKCFRLSAFRVWGLRSKIWGVKELRLAAEGPEALHTPDARQANLWHLHTVNLGFRV